MNKNSHHTSDYVSNLARCIDEKLFFDFNAFYYYFAAAAAVKVVAPVAVDVIASHDFWGTFASGGDDVGQLAYL